MSFFSVSIFVQLCEVGVDVQYVIFESYKQRSITIYAKQQQQLNCNYYYIAKEKEQEISNFMRAMKSLRKKRVLSCGFLLPFL